MTPLRIRFYKRKELLDCLDQELVVLRATSPTKEQLNAFKKKRELQLSILDRMYPLKKPKPKTKTEQERRVVARDQLIKNHEMKMSQLTDAGERVKAELKHLLLLDKFDNYMRHPDDKETVVEYKIPYKERVREKRMRTFKKRQLKAEERIIKAYRKDTLRLREELNILHMEQQKEYEEFLAAEDLREEKLLSYFTERNQRIRDEKKSLTKI